MWTRASGAGLVPDTLQISSWVTLGVPARGLVEEPVLESVELDVSSVEMCMDQFSQKSSTKSKASCKTSSSRSCRVALDLVGLCWHPSPLIAAIMHDHACLILRIATEPGPAKGCPEPSAPRRISLPVCIVRAHQRVCTCNQATQNAAPEVVPYELEVEVGLLKACRPWLPNLAQTRGKQAMFTYSSCRGQHKALVCELPQ